MRSLTHPLYTSAKYPSLIMCSFVKSLSGSAPVEGDIPDDSLLRFCLSCKHGELSDYIHLLQPEISPYYLTSPTLFINYHALLLLVSQASPLLPQHWVYCITSTRKKGSGDLLGLFMNLSTGIWVEPMRSWSG